MACVWWRRHNHRGISFSWLSSTLPSYASVSVGGLWGCGFKSHPAVACRSMREMCSPTFCFKVAEDVEGYAETRRLDPAQTPRDSVCRQRRVWIQGQGNLGRDPGRWTSNDDFISFVGTSVFCGSLQSLCAMDFLLTSGWVVAGFGDFRWRSLLELPTMKGSRDLL